MQRTIASLLSVLLLSVGTSIAQTTPVAQTPDAQKIFEQQVLHQKFFLQGFSADPKVTFVWTNGLATMPSTPMLRTLGVVIPESVKINSGHIEIRAIRSTLETDKPDHYALAGNSPITIDIDLNGASAAEVFSSLKQAIFFNSITEALQQVPTAYQRFIPFKLFQTSPPGKPKAFHADSCPANAVAPKIKSHVDPDFSDEAHRKRIGGSVMVAFTVDETGHVSDPWIARAAGFGLDEQAAKAVLKYTFQPATCDGMPIKVALAVDVNFQFS